MERSGWNEIKWIYLIRINVDTTVEVFGIKGGTVSGLVFDWNNIINIFLGQYVMYQM